MEEGAEANQSAKWGVVEDVLAGKMTAAAAFAAGCQ